MPPISARFKTEFETFAAGFGRSKRTGNLWRNFEGLTLTIFSRRPGKYCWVSHDGDGPRYSQETFESESDALDALWMDLSETLSKERV